MQLKHKGWGWTCQAGTFLWGPQLQDWHLHPSKVVCKAFSFYNYASCVLWGATHVNAFCHTSGACFGVECFPYHLQENLCCSLSSVGAVASLCQFIWDLEPTGIDLCSLSWPVRSLWSRLLHLGLFFQGRFDRCHRNICHIRSVSMKLQVWFFFFRNDSVSRERWSVQS